MTKLSPSGALEAEPLDLGSTDPRTSKLIGQHVGNYIIDRPLARGGMGAVFVAKHPRLGREVAVKFLDAEVSSRVELSQRFLSEAQVTASLKHPNIVDILDFGELEGRLYYVMELLRGQSLAAYMDERGRFSLTETLEVVRQICGALDAAHGAGVVHRDLKPANIIVLEGSPVRIKLVDFGVAKLMTTSEGHTRNGQVLGTPSHMAPEQAMGSIHLITPQTDLYSVGVIAYEMLTGAPPFTHESEFMLMIMHVRDPVPPIRERVGDIPEDIAHIIEGCLAKSPNERPKSARELDERLRAALGTFSGDANLVSELQPQAPLRQAPSAATNFGATIADTGRDATEYDRSAVFPVSKPTSATLVDDGSVGVSIQEAALGDQVVVAGQNTLRSEQDLGAKQVTAFAPVDATPKTLTSGKSPERAPAAARAVVVPQKVELPHVAVPEKVTKVSLAVSENMVPLTLAPAEKVAPVHLAAPESVLAPSFHEPRLSMVESVQNFSQTPETLVSPSEGTSGPDTAQSTLNKLMARLQRKGDFPAFAQSVGEVSVKADANSAFSASQLGESILKDYALTAKLLRVINSTYGGRFGGKIYSIRHAIVLLGFDKIRSLALGISLFKNSGKGAQSEFISDSAISSIVSGEIARAIAGDAKVNDEEAMVCAMFRNLGRHLTIVYLPELFEQIQVVCQRDRLSERVGAERVMGLSFPKLGTAVAQNWHLPPGVIGAIAARSSAGALTTSEDRANAVAEFSNELCEIVSSESAATRSLAISELLGRHRRLLSLNEQDVMKLVTTVEDVFQQRYASVLGLDARASRFLTNVAAMNAPTVPEVAAGGNAHVSVDVTLPAEHATPEVKEEIHDVAARARPTVAKLELGKKPAPNPAKRPPTEPEKPLTPLEQAIEKLRVSLGTAPSDTVLNQALRLWSEHLGLKRLLLLVGTPARDELVVRAGLHDDLDALMKEFRIGLKVPRGATNVFQTAYTGVKDLVVSDVFSEQATSTVPQRYYEILGSPAFALYACGGKGRPPLLLLAHVDAASQLPSSERLLEILGLRAVIAQAAAGR